MANSTKRQLRLLDAYTFPGFRPQPVVRGVFGDSKARIITLARHSKQRLAAVAGEFNLAGTTGARGRCATCLAATRVFTWKSKYGACNAGIAAK